MDPFATQLDPILLLNNGNLDLPSSSKCLLSLDAWEVLLMDTQTCFAAELKKHDNNLMKNLRPIGIGRNARIRGLREENKKGLVRGWEKGLLNRDILHFQGIGFAYGFNRTPDRLVNWMKEKARVSIKLSPEGGCRTTNRLIQGIIISFDASWNILLRDVDEIYRPYNGKLIQRPSDTAYHILANGLYRRSLGSFMVMGKQIVCVYAAPPR